MHPYSIDSKERIYIPIFLFIISFIICYLLNIVFKHYNISIPTYLEGPTPFVLFGLLFNWFDKDLWNTKLLRINIVKTPDLNGIWEGEYISSYKDQGNENKAGKVQMKIEQTWTKIRITSCYDTSSSYSIVAGILLDYHKGTVLKFEYENDAEKNMIDSMTLHTGFTSLKFNQDCNQLEGTYYTDKNRKTYGTLIYDRLR